MIQASVDVYFSATDANKNTSENSASCNWKMSDVQMRTIIRVGGLACRVIYAVLLHSTNKML